MERPSDAAAQAVLELKDAAVRFPAGVFQLGARLEDLPRPLRALDVRERLGLGALLRPTPPRWVYLPAFSLAARPVTNGEYLRFVEDPGYEDAARWQRVFEDHAIDQVDHYAAPDARDEERLRKTWESYQGVRSFLLAFVRSIVSEVERDLDLSPRFAEKRSVWEETRPLDRPRASELALLVALAARAFAPSLPQDYRRDLAPDERDRLSGLDLSAAASPPGAAPGPAPAAPSTSGATRDPGPSGSGGFSAPVGTASGALGRPILQKLAVEGLDAVIGRLRDRLLDALRREGPARVAPEFERGLVERDYAAPDFQIASLKFLDRLRAAYARIEPGETRIPLRRILYPLSWASDEPRSLQRERDDRVPWADRPVTGVSLYEALAYADWLTRSAGDKTVVRLPSEAQLERAASWPVRPSETRPDGGTRELVDPRWKLLLPWETRSPDDPALYAPESDEPRSFAQLFPDRDRSPFELEASELRELIRRTSRPVGEKRLDMLLGFHWEWTRDRLSELEPGYEQLERAEPLGREHEAFERGKDQPVAATYYAGSSQRSSWFAARGGPRRIGGPGLTTRRFGLYPLRGAPEVGFRLVVEPARRVPGGRA